MKDYETERLSDSHKIFINVKISFFSRQFVKGGINNVYLCMIPSKEKTDGKILNLK